MRGLVILVWLVCVGASPARAQDRDDRSAARARTLARWTESQRTIEDAHPPDPRAILCVGRAPSCTCPGLPMGPRPVWTNQDAVIERIMRCVENSLHGPGPVGRLELELTVAPDGHVRAGRVVANETGDEGAAACVLRAVMTARFAPIRGSERVVRYPIVFAAPPEAPTPPDAPVRASGSSASR